MKTNRLICATVAVLAISSFSASAQMPRPKRPECLSQVASASRRNRLSEAKSRKILSAGQYDTWRKLHPDPSGFFFE